MKSHSKISMGLILNPYGGIIRPMSSFDGITVWPQLIDWDERFKYVLTYFSLDSRSNQQCAQRCSSKNTQTSKTLTWLLWIILFPQHWNCFKDLHNRTQKSKSKACETHYSAWLKKKLWRWSKTTFVCSISELIRASVDEQHQRQRNCAQNRWSSYQQQR